MKILNSCKYSIHLIKTYKDNKFYYIIMELCDKSLQDLINGEKKTEIKTIKNILKQLNVILKMMREKNMIHRDIKPSNILIKKENNKPTIRLTDYGLSKLLSVSNKASTYVGTKIYIAPEIELENFQDIKISDKSKVDLWSIGIMIYELYFKTLPFKKESDYILFITNYGNSQYINLEKTPDNDLNNLIENLLVFDYKNRLSWEDYFNHKFFFSFTKEKNKFLNNFKNLSKKFSDFFLLKEQIIKNEIELMKNDESDKIVLLNKNIEKLLLTAEINNEEFNEYFSIIKTFSKQDVKKLDNHKKDSLIKKRE